MSLPALVAVNVAVLAQREAAMRKRVLEPFRRADATAPDRAIAFEPERRDRDLFGSMRRKRALVEAGPGRFWYDESARKAAERSAASKALAVLAGMGAIVLASLALTK